MRFVRIVRIVFGLVVQWIEAKGGHERPAGMPESASKKPRSSGGSGGEVTGVRSTKQNEGRSANEDAPSTQPTVAPRTSLSTTHAVYPILWRPNVCEGIPARLGYTAELLLWVGRPLREFCSREPDLLVSLFTRFGNYQCKAGRKIDLKLEGGHAAEDLWEIVLSPGTNGYASVTVGVT